MKAPAIKQPTGTATSRPFLRPFPPALRPPPALATNDVEAMVRKLMQQAIKLNREQFALSAARPAFAGSAASMLPTNQVSIRVRIGSQSTTASVGTASFRMSTASALVLLDSGTATPFWSTVLTEFAPPLCLPHVRILRTGILVSPQTVVL